jgi:hypothetical protein
MAEIFAPVSAAPPVTVIHTSEGEEIETVCVVSAQLVAVLIVQVSVEFEPFTTT